MLTGAQRVPPVVTNAGGAGSATLSVDRSKVRLKLDVAGLSGAITAAHLHQGALGVEGDFLRALTMTGLATSQVWSDEDAVQPFTASSLAKLEAGGLYFNVHTALNVDGEIRGQLLPVNRARSGGLDGAQVVPASASTAKGVVTGALAADRKSLTIEATVAGQAGAITAHVHKAAVGATGAAILKTLTFDAVTGKAKLVWTDADGTDPLTAALITSFEGGELYVDVHTPTFAAGEVRGQLTAP